MPEDIVSPRDAPSSPLARARSGALLACVAAGLLAGVVVAWNGTLGVRLAPGRPGWGLVQGPGAAGQTRGRAVFTLPGFDRSTPRTLILDAGRADGGAATLLLVADSR